MSLDIDKLYNSKWEDAMPKIASNSVDLIVTSPPYNVSLGDNKHKKDKYDGYEDNMPYDEYLKWIKKLFVECHRVLKVGGRFSVNIGEGRNGQIPTHVDFTTMLLNLSLDEDPFQMMTTIIWNKNQVGARTAWGSFKSPSQPSFPTPIEFI